MPHVTVCAYLVSVAQLAYAPDVQSHRLTIANFVQRCKMESTLHDVLI